MSVEINEMIIKARTTQSKADGDCLDDAARAEKAQEKQAMQEEILAQCRDMVLDLLRERMER